MRSSLAERLRRALLYVARPYDTCKRVQLALLHLLVTGSPVRVEGDGLILYSIGVVWRKASEGFDRYTVARRLQYFQNRMILETIDLVSCAIHTYRMHSPMHCTALQE
jgi:hypothetical protein